MRYETLSLLDSPQIEALYLRDLAIQRVTTPIGRALMYAANLPYAPFKGLYLPAPNIPRHLQASPDEDSSFTEDNITISRGIDVPVVGMTVIGFSEPFAVEPHAQIIYDFTHSGVYVNFYRYRTRISDLNHPSVEKMLVTLGRAVRS